tara:strand:+ start:641 stop:1489 length:849 start_codon:yes stop_codon:yes gene_type:complete
VEVIIRGEKLLKLGQSILKNNNVPNYNLDARILLAYLLSLENKYFMSDIKVTNKDKENFFSLIKDRINGKPVSKIISRRDFWDTEFYINSSTLDPRPDSEILVKSALEVNKFINKEKINILELGVGSGCILLSLLNEINGSIGIGIDIDIEALKVAQLNALNMKISEKVSFIASNWTKSIKGKFDIIISNPPYIKSSNIINLQKEVKNHDPLIALDGGEDGLICYKEIMKNIKGLMKKNAFLLLEIDSWQGNIIIELSKKNHLKFFSIKKDLSGKERCIIFQ